MTFSNSDLRRTAKRLVERWAPDPVLFSKEALNVTLWDDQADYHDQGSILRSVAKYKRTAVRSGQKTGKSTGLSCLSLWWPLTRWRGKVVLTAPSHHQVKNILWPEVHRLYHAAPFPLGGKLHKDPSSGWELPGGRGVICVTTDKPERMQGLSGENILFLIDEGSGYPEDLWEPIFGNLAGGGSLCTTGNPTRTSGPYFEAFAHPGAWNLLHIDSENNPNARTGRTVISGLATRDFIEERRNEWGEDSAAFQVRIKGNFPSQADNAVIALGLVQAAEERWAATPFDGELVLGVDVARFGDDESVIQPRRGQRTIPPEVVQGMDVVQVAGKVRQVAKTQRRNGEKVRVHVDEIGVGAGVVDILKQDEDLTVVGVNVAETATAEGYSRLRDQIWFAMKDWLKEGGALHEDHRLHSELVAPTYQFDAQGRQLVESKKDIKKRLGRSPDRADALGLSIYRPPFDDGPVFHIPSRRR